MKLRRKPFNVEIQCQHSLWLLLFSFQAPALKHLSCHGADSFWQTTVSQSSSLCQRLSALLWAWRAVGRRLCDRLDFTLTRAPSPVPCPATDVIISLATHAYTQTHAWNVSAPPLSLSHYLPLFTFLLLPQKQYQTSCSPHWTHTHTRINTGPTSRLMLIWHHQRGV